MDIHNEEIKLAWDFVEHTRQSIFLTGNAGTGKTTFLKNVIQHSNKRIVVVAPTGIAAMNAGGVTIHSFFQLPLAPFIPQSKVHNIHQCSAEKRKIIRTLDLLIIDEISMVRSDLLDAIDKVMRRYRKPDQPFGGVQLLMIGDLQQLTPVTTNADEELLRPHYATSYFYGSHALQQLPYTTIQLKTIYRQQDKVFIDLLNHIRNGNVTNTDLDLLNSRYLPAFQPSSKDGFIRLTTHNHMADRYNQSELNKLTSQAYHYNAEVKDIFPESAYPTSNQLILKTGAQVMFIKNDTSPEHLFYNGKIGQVVCLDDDHIEVKCPGEQHTITVEKQIWENKTYKINNQTNEVVQHIQGTFCQYPLRLAWAITIHKSQGLTFDKTLIDAESSFAPGQVYVALSRCRTLEGLVLATPIHQNTILHDDSVNAYISQQEEQAKQSVMQLPLLKRQNEQLLLAELFDFKYIIQEEERITRLFCDSFHTQTNLKDAHQTTLAKLNQQVGSVALKWTHLIFQLTIEQIQEPAFQQRIIASAHYFIEKLNECLAKLIDQTSQVASNNKIAKKRLNTYLTDLKEAYLSKIYVLQTMADEGFTTYGYLKANKDAIINTINQTTTPTRQRQKKTIQIKEKRESTKNITLNMLKDGLSIPQIATQRGLSASTICNHLAAHIQQGQLSVADILDQTTIQTIRQVIEKVGINDGKTAIKSLCPPHVTYDDITLVLATYANNK